jgi:serine/threonine protein kinase
MVELMREKASGQAVAVKHMNMTAKSDRDQTIEEVRSMWRLDHANVVRFYGAYFCAKDQTVCFVLEYMNSNSLQHILKNCRQTPMAEPVVGRLVADTWRVSSTCTQRRSYIAISSPVTYSATTMDR